MPNRFTKPGGGSGGGGGNAAKSEGSSTAKSDAGTRSYSEAARGRDWEAELSDLRKANAKLLRQVATLQSGQAAGEDDDMDDDDGDEAARDDRIKTLESGIPVLVGIYSEDAVQVKEARDELQALVRQRRESKPLRTQLQNIDRRIDKQRLRSERLQSKSDEIWEQISALRNEHSSVAEELEETKDGLAKLEDERKALLLKEAQAAEAAATARPTAPPEDAAWDTVMEAIGARINIPGANQHLATQVAATVQMLKDLLVQCAPPACGSVAATQVQQPEAPPPPQPQQAVGQLVVAAGAAVQPNVGAHGLGDASEGHGTRPTGAGARERTPRPRADTARLRAQGRSDADGSRHAACQEPAGHGSAEDAIAAAAPQPVAADVPAVPGAGTQQENAAAVTQAATAAGCIGTPPSGGDDGDDDGKGAMSTVGESGSELEGGESEGDEIEVDIEQAIALLPDSQRRAKVREVLARRRKAQPRRLKKPEAGTRGGAGDRDGKKPTKGA